MESLSDYRERPAGTVRLNLPRVAAEFLLTSKLPEFAALYPDIHIDMIIEDRLADIVGSGCDAGVRPGELLQQDMIAVRMTPDVRTAVVGSPAYFEKHSKPKVPADLAEHACINYRFAETGALYRWPFSKGNKRMEVEVTGSLTLNDAGLMVKAALSGMELACTLEDNIIQELSDGRLMRVLENWCPPSPGFLLYYPSRRHLSGALRAFIDFMRLDGDLPDRSPKVVRR